jgi:tetratricopeptide (TPR) repeat protein
VEPKQLTDLLHHFTSSSTQEAEEVMALCDEYPYSQVLQALSARVSKDHNFENQQQLLQMAAVYSTDRSVLKDIMSKVYETAQVKEAVNESTSDQPISAVSTIHSASVDTTIDYADEVIHDLERLHELKHNFETLAAGFGLSSPQVGTEKPKRKPPGRPKKEIQADPLIEAIKTTKKKIDPESPRTKEQIAIIDQFIKAQPSIKPKTDQAPPSDLTEIKSGEFADNIISETLAEILIRQGKKEKAIEVYRKLIWKFPQKKAYFAAQIEELKK